MNNIFKYHIISTETMTTQINLRITEEFLAKAKEYAEANGFLNVQEFFREAAREKLFEKEEIKESYLKRLQSKEANKFLSNKETEIFEKEAELRSR
jgi:uncharacterized LabA/DUF88 family protein